jgi:hypothetical protein
LPSSEARDWLVRTEAGWLLSIWVQPGARSTEPAGILDGCLKLRLAAPPIEGRANDALLRWIAQRLSLPRRDVELTAGQASRRKRVRVTAALEADELARRLLAER